jgi:hypothetical protein
MKCGSNASQEELEAAYDKELEENPKTRRFRPEAEEEP